MKKILVVIGFCLIALPSTWAGKSGYVKATPMSILDAQLSASELQQAMENVSELGRRENPRSIDATLRFSAVESPLRAPQQKPSVVIKVRLRTTPLYEPEIVKLPWTRPVPSTVKKKFAALEIRLAQRDGKWVKVKVVPNYYAHFLRCPTNSPVYLGQATIESLGVSRALAKALPVGGDWRVLFRPLLQNAVRLAAKLAAWTA